MTRNLSIIFLLLSTLSILGQVDASATKAKVTFYSNAMSLLGGFPGHKQPAFKGRLFDGDKELAFMEPNHFITFELIAGIHTLTATTWMAKHATTGVHLTIDLQANQHYYIEASSVNPGSGPGLFKIRVVDCNDANQYNLKTKPLEASHLRSDGVPLAVAEKQFPHCY